MPKQLDLDDILSRNPQIDQDQLKRALEMLKRLRENGVQRKGYDLAPPFGGRRVSVQDDPRNSPRLLQSRRAYKTE